MRRNRPVVLLALLFKHPLAFVAAALANRRPGLVVVGNVRLVPKLYAAHPAVVAGPDESHLDHLVVGGPALRAPLHGDDFDTLSRSVEIVPNDRLTRHPFVSLATGVRVEQPQQAAHVRPVAAHFDPSRLRRSRKRSRPAPS